MLRNIEHLAVESADRRVWLPQIATKLWSKTTSQNNSRWRRHVDNAIDDLARELRALFGRPADVVTIAADVWSLCSRCTSGMRHGQRGEIAAAVGRTLRLRRV